MKENKVYDYAKERIIKQLEDAIANNDVAPWEKPWVGLGRARNGITEKSYRGINALLADAGRHYTMKQIKESKNLKLKDNAKGNSTMIVFWSIADKNTGEYDEEGKEIVKTISYSKYYNVFHENFVDGLEEIETFEHESNINADELISSYIEKTKLTFELYDKSDRAFYSPSNHLVRVPKMKNFKAGNEYYSTIFHELVHSTSKDLKRELGSSFGASDYSKEELVAEIGSSMLMNILGLNNNKSDNNSIAYLKAWHSRVKEENSSFLVNAAQQAQKAVDYILSSLEEKTKQENIA